MNTRCGRIALIGRPNVGKSTLLNALLDQNLSITSHKPQTTRDAIAGIITNGKTQYIFVDTPGLHTAKNRLGSRMNAYAEGEIAQADVVALVTDGGKSGVHSGDKALLEKVKASGLPTILLLNKIDRIHPKSLLAPVLIAYGEAFNFEAIIPLSAQKKDGLGAFLKAAAPHLPEGPFAFAADEMTDKPLRFFVAEYVRERILVLLREEVPHGIAVVVERFEDDRKVPHIDLVVHVDKASHKGMVIGKGGAMLKRIGAEARAKVESLMDRQVNLSIVVRTTPKWYEKNAALDDLGYGRQSNDEA
jgi:GTPase